MDEYRNNETAQEVVLRYVAPKPEGISCCYVQDKPLPGRYYNPAQDDAPKEKKRRRKGLRIFLICVALCVVLAVLGVLLRHFVRVWFFAPEYPEMTENVPHGELQRAAVGGEARLRFTCETGEELSAQEVYEKVNPATVMIAAGNDAAASLGTGIILSADGYVITNAHVIENMAECVVVLNDGTMYDALLVGADSDEDLAVLKVEAEGLPCAEFGDSDSLRVGDKVYAIGNPLGVRLRGTMTDGIISAIDRTMNVDTNTMTMLQTNAALNSGNSGGPLINAYGQVIGINTMKLCKRLYSSSASIEGLGFAIPVSVSAYKINDLIRCGEIRGEPLIGFTVITTGEQTPDGRTGFRLREVTPDSGADDAGLKADDIIVAVNGEALTSHDDIIRARRQLDEGGVLTMEFCRGGVYDTADVVLKVAE